MNVQLSLRELLFLLCGSGSITLAIVIILVVYFANHLEILVKVPYLFIRALHFFRLTKKRQLVASQISSKVNVSIVPLLKEVPSIFAHSFKLKLITDDEEFATVEEGEVIVRVKDSPHQDKVFAKATMLYLEKAVIYLSRPFLERRLLEAIDITLAERILLGMPGAHKYLQSTYKKPLLEDDRFVEYYQLVENLDSNGVLTRIVLREFSGLSRKATGKERTSKHKPPARIRNESVEFTKYVNRVMENHNDEAPLRFLGSQFQTTIGLIGRREIIRSNDVRLYKRLFRKDIENGIRTVYLLARGSENVRVARDLAKWAQEQNLISGAFQGKYYWSSHDGRSIISNCIVCPSAKSGNIVTFGPIEEVYMGLSEAVPEVLSGVVEIMDVEREPTILTKVAVRSLDQNDPTTYFLGSNGDNIGKLKAFLSPDEEIDIIKWSAAPEDYVTSALCLHPNNDISKIIIEPQDGVATVYVSSQAAMSRAIGLSGINVKLAARITGYRITIELDPNVKSPEQEALDCLKNVVTEVSNGIIEVQKIVRQPGEITKILLGKNELINSFNICIAKMPEIRKSIGDKYIHIISADDDVKNLIVKALYPLKPGEVREVILHPTTAIVNVITEQTRRDALGANGINVRLAEKLTGIRIEIRLVE